MSTKRGILVLLSLVAAVPQVWAAGVLNDVKGNWAEEAVRNLYERGILTGFPDGLFRGNDPLTRYQAAVLLWRAYLVWAEEVVKELRPLLDRHEARISEILPRLQALEEGLALLEKGVEDLEDLRASVQEVKEAVGALREDLAQLGSEVASRGEVEEAMGTLASLEDALNRQSFRLKGLEERLDALERTVNELKTDGAKLEEGLKALKEEVQRQAQRAQGKPRFGVRFGAGPNAGEVFVFASTQGVRLKGGLTERGPEVEGEALPVRFTYREGEGLAAYRLFSGVYVEVGLGGGGNPLSPFLQARGVHDVEGGVVPALYLEGIGRLALKDSLGLSYGVKVGYRFSEFFPALAYYRQDYSTLEGSLTWRVGAFRLSGAYRFLANPNGSERGGQGVVEVQTGEGLGEGRVYLSASLSYQKGVTNGEPLSFGRPYRFTDASSLDWRLVVGYEVGW